MKLNIKRKQNKITVIIILIIVLALAVYLISNSILSTHNNSKSSGNIHNVLNKKPYFLETYTFGTNSQNSTSQSLVKVKDGYVMLGINDLYALYLLKTDFLGNVIWNKQISKKHDSYFVFGSHNLFKNDNSFIAAGVVNGLYKSKLAIIKANFNGSVDWTKTFDLNSNNNYLISTAITRTNKNNILALVVSPNNQSIYTTTLYNIDQQGNLIWKKDISKDIDHVESLKTINDGYLIAGTIPDHNKSLTYIYFAKINNSGDIVWSKEFGDSGDNSVYFVLSKNNGYLLVGFTDSLGIKPNSGFILKTNLQGNKQWVNSILVSNYSRINVITKANDSNGYIVAGSAYNSFDANSYIGNTTIFIMKTDNNGKKIWEKDYNSSGFGMVNGIVNSANGYAITGQIYPTKDLEHGKAYLLSVDNLGNISN